jgi:hypothetical protein
MLATVLALQYLCVVALSHDIDKIDQTEAQSGEKWTVVIDFGVVYPILR